MIVSPKKLLILLLFTSTALFATDNIEDIMHDANKGDVQAQFELANAYHLGDGVNQDDKLAFYWYKQVAIKGYATAQFNVANSYYNGMGVEKDVNSAVIWYEKAAKQNLPSAAHNLATIYFANNDINKSLYWYERAAELGYLLSQLNLAKIYSDGKVVKQDKALAEQWYKQAVAQQSPVAAYQYALFLTAEGRHQEALKFYQEAATAGHIEAQYQMAYFYKTGKYGVKVDNDKAFSLLSQAAASNYADAQYLLGVMYKTYKQDEKNAHKWYQKAADNGNAFAEYAIAVDYLNKGDNTNATKYFIQSADKGYANAQYSLALRYLKGIGIEQNDTEAVKWLEKAAEQNHALAQYSLSVRYKLGQGVEKDEEKRIYYLEQAYQNGNKEAEYELAALTLNGKKTSLSVESAQNILDSMVQDHSNAGYILGSYLLPTDKDKALEYLQIAANNDNKYAQKLLHSLNTTNTVTIATTPPIIEESQQNTITTQDGTTDKNSLVTTDDMVAPVTETTDTTNDEITPSSAIAQVDNTPIPTVNTSLATTSATVPDNTQHITQPPKKNTPLQEKNTLPQTAQDTPKYNPIQILEMGAYNGDIVATHQLALSYLNGSGVEKNLNKAAQLMHIAAEKGYPVAQNDLANMYLRGVGVEMDYRQAYYWAIKALQQNYIPAQNTLFLLQQR